MKSTRRANRQAQTIQGSAQIRRGKTHNRARHSRPAEFCNTICGRADLLLAEADFRG
jgi:hypothetical protein